MTRADDLIARALSGAAPWPAGMSVNLVTERAIYHGVTGILMARTAHIADWPKGLHTRLHAEALAQTMWEIRHRTILTPIVDALKTAGVKSVLLKGTALAYGLYPVPAQRKRGDTDLLVAPNNLDRTRTILEAQGFSCDVPMVEIAAPVRQEGWSFTASDGSRHEIDLHVEVFSSPALIPVLEGSTALESAVPLPALSPDAHALSLPLALLQDRAATLRGINLDIPAGQTLALTGANGSGKTTLGRRRRNAHSSAVRRSVPIRTYADWKDPAPGYMEADLVAHSGCSATIWVRTARQSG